MGEKRNVYRLLVRKPEGKRPLGRPRHRWVNNIRMDLGEVGWGDMNWIGLAKDRNRWIAIVNSVLNLQVPTRLTTHPNDQILTLMEIPGNRRLRRHVPNDLPNRFLV
jgi:hypothetical protein